MLYLLPREEDSEGVRNENRRKKRNIRKSARNKYQKLQACELCNSRDDLTIHHKDLDYRNNIIDNLQTLCRECHEDLHGNKPRERKKAVKKWFREEHILLERYFDEDFFSTIF